MKQKGGLLLIKKIRSSDKKLLRKLKHLSEKEMESITTNANSKVTRGEKIRDFEQSLIPVFLISRKVNRKEEAYNKNIVEKKIF